MQMRVAGQVFVFDGSLRCPPFRHFQRAGPFAFKAQYFVQGDGKVEQRVRVGGFVEVDFAFIQFAGFTFGKAVSQFDPQWALAKPYISSGFLAGSNDATGIPMLAYTATFGNGLSATIYEAITGTVPPSSFDAAISRNCLMFVSNLPRALGAIRTALRPGARFAASVWGPLQRNPFHSAPIAAVRRRRAIPSPAPEVVRAFSMCDGDAVVAALHGAGFRGVELRPVVAPRRFPSFEEALKSGRQFPTFVALLGLLPEAEREQAWEEIAREWSPFATPAGLELPGEQLVIAGQA